MKTLTLLLCVLFFTSCSSYITMKDIDAVVKESESKMEEKVYIMFNITTMEYDTVFVEYYYKEPMLKELLEYKKKQKKSKKTSLANPLYF